MTTEGHDFKKQFGFFSRLNIRAKLISIISIIIIAAMAIMISLATLFFKKDNEVRIKESNLTISQVVASKTESDFTALVEKLNLMGTTILQEFKTAEQKNLFINMFFSNDKDFLYVGICDRGKDDVLRVTRKLANDKFFTDNNIDQAFMARITADNSHKFVKSFNDEAVVHNVSERFTFPVMAVSFPFQRDANDRVVSVLVGYIKLNRILKAFVKNGITDTFMVNSDGDVIAHPDSNLIMSHANLVNLPIIDRMMKSKSDNEQTRYRDDSGVYYLGSFKKIGFSGIGIVSTVPEGLAMQEVYNIQRRNIIITIIILNIAILIVYFFSKSLSNPLTRLVKATKEIETGNFRVSIKPTTGDEIGVLTDSFVEMGRGLEEREKMKDAFG
ncbi:MAG TPA: cache and HAMP domain-containing protein, partial [Spirochaetota bacterium]|nr:cache and HAMP domain-containing protein [Spirochaetota bacterium]